MASEAVDRREQVGGELRPIADVSPTDASQVKGPGAPVHRGEGIAPSSATGVPVSH